MSASLGPNLGSSREGGRARSVVTPAEALALLARWSPPQRRLAADLLALRLAGWDAALAVPLTLWTPRPAEARGLVADGVCARLDEASPEYAWLLDLEGPPPDWMGVEPANRLWGVALTLLAGEVREGAIVDDAAWVRGPHHLP